MKTLLSRLLAVLVFLLAFAPFHQASAVEVIVTSGGPYYWHHHHYYHREWVYRHHRHYYRYW